MTRWLLRCTRCGNTWVLEVSFDLTKLATKRLYHYCPHCRRNTFHEVLERIDNGEGQQGEYTSQPPKGEKGGSGDRRNITPQQ